MARSSAVTAAAVGRSTPNAISPATRPPSTGPRPAIAGTTPPSIASMQSVAICVGGSTDAEREGRAGQPQEVLQPQQRRVADACREQRRAHAAQRESRRQPLERECRTQRVPERDRRASAERDGERDDDAGRPPCRRERPHGDERHAAQHRESAAARTGDPRPRRPSPAVHVARPPRRTSADAAGLAARRRASGSRRRSRPASRAWRASTLTSPPSARRKPRHRAPAMNRLTTYSRQARGGVGGPGARQAFEAARRRCARWRAKLQSSAWVRRFAIGSFGSR